MGAGVTVEPVADVERGQLRIAVIGLAGSGKSTFAGVVAELAHERGLRCARLGLAAPLYALQERVYEAARTPLREGAQDQVLMETLARAHHTDVPCATSRPSSPAVSTAAGSTSSVPSTRRTGTSRSASCS